MVSISFIPATMSVLLVAYMAAVQHHDHGRGRHDMLPCARLAGQLVAYMYARASPVCPGEGAPNIVTKSKTHLAHMPQKRHDS